MVAHTDVIDQPPIQPNAAELQHFFELLYLDVEDGWIVLSYPDPTRVTPQGTNLDTVSFTYMRSAADCVLTTSQSVPSCSSQ